VLYSAISKSEQKPFFDLGSAQMDGDCHEFA